MLWFFRRLLDRLVVRVTGAIASQIESHVQLELSEAQAGLLRRAKELEHEDTPGIEQIVSDLRKRAERLGTPAALSTDAVDFVAELQHENLRDIESLCISHREESKPHAIELANGSKRGRPKKAAKSDSDPA